MNNPLDSVHGTIVAGIVITIVLDIVVEAAIL